MLSQALTQFALRLIFGMSVMLLASDYRKTSSGFYRIQMLVVLGFGVLASLFVGRDVETAVGSTDWGNWMTANCVLISAAAFLGSVLWTLERRTAAHRVIAIITTAATGGLIMNALQNHDAFSIPLFQIISDASSGAVLGGAMTGMLLGHWYLTAPTMSLDPLLRLIRLFGVAVAVRFVVSLVGLAWGWQEIDGLTMAMLVVMRWVFGIVGPLVAYVMTQRIMKYRNTQSATGVLFVAVIFTFLGELSGILLFLQLRTCF